MPKNFRRSVFFAVMFFLSGSIICRAQGNMQRLRISANGHFLTYADGRPFFWLGDTGWELFSRLKKEEIRHYLVNRHAKGFNVIQAVLIANTDKPLRANQYGDTPVHNLDPEKPNENYFRLVDWAVQEASRENIYMGLLPTWGDKVSRLWGTAPAIFNEHNAYDYGLFLGKRYAPYPNIIWILGGDRPAFTDSMDWRPVWRAMAKGIREGSGGKAIFSYHPWGEHSSTEFWKTENFPDINMLQSGHARRDVQVWEWIRRDYNEEPVKPIVDGEPNYEDHPVNWKPANGYFRDYDVRKQLYRSVFSGACGVTYGHQAVWQFYSPREEKIVFPDRYWTEAIDRPGAFQAGFLKKLILSRPSLERVPDQSILLGGQAGGDSAARAQYITAFRDGSNRYAMIYFPVGKTVSITTSWMPAIVVSVWWFNPKTGRAQSAGVVRNKKQQSFTPPSTGTGNDWVLVLDDAAKKWPAPGAVAFGKQ